MIELQATDRNLLKALTIPKEEVCIWACIEGKMGRAWVDDLEQPGYGVVAVADFLFLLGQVPETVTAEWIQLVETYGKNQIIVCEASEWEVVLLATFPDNHVPFKRYAFHREPEAFDRTFLEACAQTANLPYEVVPFTKAMAELALTDSFTADFCMFFESPDHFLEQGLGYGIIHENRLIAGASSYSACEGAIDITIGTVSDYRRQGLGLVCGAQLILACLERGIYPRWDAANLESVVMAEKLGYRFKSAYQVYTIK